MFRRSLRVLAASSPNSATAVAATATPSQHQHETTNHEEKQRIFDVDNIRKFTELARIHSVVPSTQLFAALQGKIQQYSLPSELNNIKHKELTALLRLYSKFNLGHTKEAALVADTLMKSVQTASLRPVQIANAFAACVEHCARTQQQQQQATIIQHQHDEDQPAKQQQQPQQSQHQTEIPISRVKSLLRDTASSLKNTDLVHLAVTLGEIISTPNHPSTLGSRDLVQYASAAAELIAEAIPEIKKRLPTLMPNQICNVAFAALPVVTLLGARNDVVDFFFTVEQRLALYVGEVDEVMLSKVLAQMQRRGLSVEMLTTAMKQFQVVESSVDRAPDVQEILRSLFAFSGSRAAEASSGQSQEVQQVYLERSVRALRDMDVPALRQLLLAIPTATVSQYQQALLQSEKSAMAEANQVALANSMSNASGKRKRTSLASSSASSDAAAASANNISQQQQQQQNTTSGAAAAHRVLVAVLERLDSLLLERTQEGTGAMHTPLPMKEILRVLRATALHFRHLPLSGIAAPSSAASSSFSSSSSSSPQAEQQLHNKDVRALFQQVASRSIRLALSQPASELEALNPIDLAQVAASLRYLQLQSSTSSTTSTTQQQAQQAQQATSDTPTAQQQQQQPASSPSSELRQLVDRIVQRGLRNRIAGVAANDRLVFLCLLGKVPVHAGSLLRDAIMTTPGLQQELLGAILQPPAAMALLCGLCQLQEPWAKEIFIRVSKKMVESPVYPVGAGHLDSVVELTAAMVQHRVVFPSLVNGLADVVVGCAQMCHPKDLAAVARNFALLGMRDASKLRTMAEHVLVEKPPSIGNTANILMALCQAAPDSPLVAQCCARIRVNSHQATLEETALLLHAFSLLPAHAVSTNPGNAAAVVAAVEQATTCLERIKQNHAREQQRTLRGARSVAPPRVSIQAISTIVNSCGPLQALMIVGQQLQPLLAAIGALLPEVLNSAGNNSNADASSATSSTAVTADQAVQLWSLYALRLPNDCTAKHEAVGNLLSCIRHHGTACSPSVLSSALYALAEPVPLSGEQAQETCDLIYPLLTDDTAKRTALLNEQQSILAICSLMRFGMVVPSPADEPLVQRIVAVANNWCVNRELADRLSRSGLYDVVQDLVREKKRQQQPQQDSAAASNSQSQNTTTRSTKSTTIDAPPGDDAVSPPTSEFQQVARKLQQQLDQQQQRQQQSQPVTSTAAASSPRRASNNTAEPSSPRQQQQVPVHVSDAVKGFTQLCDIGGENSKVESRPAALANNKKNLQPISLAPEPKSKAKKGDKKAETATTKAKQKGAAATKGKKK